MQTHAWRFSHAHDRATASSTVHHCMCTLSVFATVQCWYVKPSNPGYIVNIIQIGWSWLVNKPFLTRQLKERKHWHGDGGTEKIQAAQLGIEPRASDFAHQCSDRWVITPQLLTTLNILPLDVYQCQHYTVGWLRYCSLQPTEFFCFSVTMSVLSSFGRCAGNGLFD